jgi:hypothetical protein
MSPHATSTVTARDVAAITTYISRVPAQWIDKDDDVDVDEVLHCVWKNDDRKASNRQDAMCLLVMMPPLAALAAALLPCTLTLYNRRKREFTRERYAVSNKRFFYWKANAASDVWSCALRDVDVTWDDTEMFPNCARACPFGGEQLQFRLSSEDAARVATLTMRDRYNDDVKHYALVSMLDEQRKLRGVIEAAKENAEKRDTQRKNKGRVRRFIRK